MKDYIQPSPPYVADLNNGLIGVLPEENTAGDPRDLQVVEEAFGIFTDPLMDEKTRGLLFLCGAKDSVWLVGQLAKDVGIKINLKKGAQVRKPISFGGDRNPDRLEGFLSEEARRVVSTEDLVAALDIWFSMKLTSEPANELNAYSKRIYLFKEMLYRSVPGDKKQEAFDYLYNLISMSDWLTEQQSTSKNILGPTQDSMTVRGENPLFSDTFYLPAGFSYLRAQMDTITPLLQLQVSYDPPTSSFDFHGQNGQANVRPVEQSALVTYYNPPITAEIAINAEYRLLDLQTVERAFTIFTDPKMDEDMRALVFLCGARDSVWLMRALAQETGNPLRFTTKAHAQKPIGQNNQSIGRLRGFLSPRASTLITDHDLSAAFATWLSMKLTPGQSSWENAESNRTHHFRTALYKSIEKEKSQAFEYFLKLISLSDWLK